MDVKSRSSLFSASTQENGNSSKLKRNLSVLGGISLVVGTMIGSGIFVSPSSIISMTGSVGSALLVWLLCGFISTIAALCYIELGLLVHETGGEYSYCNAAFGDLVGFLICWTQNLMTKPASLAVITTAFAEYVSAPFYAGCDSPDLLKKCLSISAILFISLVNGLSVKASEYMQIFFTFVKLILITLIIVGGLVMIENGNYENFSDAFSGTSTSASAWAIAIYSGMWSYDGWNQLNYVSEELVNPKKNFPIVIGVGIPLVTVCYLLVNIAYFTVMTPDDLMSSNAVAVTFGDRVFKSFPWIVPVGVACSTFGAANGSAFTSARAVYAASVNGHFPKCLSYLSHSRLTPLMAVVFNCFVGIIMVIPRSADIGTLLDYFSFAQWFIYFLTFVSLILMRLRKPMKHRKRDFKVWLPLPIFCALISIFLVIAPIVEYPSMSYAIATGVILAGIVFYIPFVFLGWQLPFGVYQKLELLIQTYFEVVPTDPKKDK